MDKKIEQDRLSSIAKIKYLIDAAGLTQADIERRYNLNRGVVHDTMREPHKAGEKAIAAALGKKACELWPERYNPTSGRRLQPQPSENYYRPPSRAARRKLEAAQT